MQNGDWLDKNESSNNYFHSLKKGNFIIMTKKVQKEKIKSILEAKKYNVYISNFNQREIETYNIFNHAGFIDSLAELFIENKELSYDAFKEEIRKILLYFFWAKCEWEVVITDWPPHISNEELERLNKEKEEYVNNWKREPYNLSYNPAVAKKIDVYEQVTNNFNYFTKELYEEYQK